MLAQMHAFAGYYWSYSSKSSLNHYRQQKEKFFSITSEWLPNSILEASSISDSKPVSQDAVEENAKVVVVHLEILTTKDGVIAVFFI
jgi:hypothetical protein